MSNMCPFILLGPAEEMCAADARCAAAYGLRGVRVGEAARPGPGRLSDAAAILPPTQVAVYDPLPVVEPAPKAPRLDGPALPTIFQIWAVAAMHTCPTVNRILLGMRRRHNIFPSSH